MSVRSPSVLAIRSVRTQSGPTRAPAGPGTQHGPRVGSVSVCISVSPGSYTCTPAGLGTQHGPRVGSVSVHISISLPESYTCFCRARFGSYRASLHHVLRIREYLKMAVIKQFRVSLT